MFTGRLLVTLVRLGTAERMMLLPPGHDAWTIGDQEISALWHVDPTLVNRHLRALAAAGLARTARRGRFVAYQLDAGAVEALGSDLLALLRRVRVTGGGRVGRLGPGGEQRLVVAD